MTRRCHGRNRIKEAGINRELSRGAAAFTLVELLVVIGIISVLIGILLPALNKARESARQAKCLNNMRQISIAAVMFASENRGWMPGRAGGGMTKISSNGAVVNGSAADVASPADWIAWQRKLDPVDGTTYSGAADQNITYSGLAKYMGGRYRTHTTPQEANSVAAKLDEVYRCPSDNLQQRNAYIDGPGGRGAYRYSYSMNLLYTNPVFTVSGHPAGQRFGSKFTGKMSSIRSSSERVLVVCEDEGTIDDGVFSPSAANWVAGGSVNAVAARHELKFKKAGTTANKQPTEQARGNVGFCDGHAEFMSRKDAISQKYSGNPNPDPAGF